MAELNPGAPEPGTAIDSARIRHAVSEILAAIGEDTNRPGLADTPKRVAQAYTEFFAGVGVDPLTHLVRTLPADDGERGELVLLRNVEFRSVCEHHLLPFSGVAHLAYVPRERIVGLGSLPQVVGTLAARPQLQERLTEEIADTLQRGLDPLGVLVVLDAVHDCMTTRGSRQAHSSTVTLATRGSLAEPAAQTGVLTLLGSRS